uniref:Phospholipid/glycerol acyltransferase domain-containing protein n=1 Tax=Gopherus agassizii TaxID=38772 RepID=A0A452GJP2_9SAUR
MEKIPEGPGLIVYYHGAIPIDYCYFICILYIQTGRLCYSVADHLFSKLPGIQLYLNLLPGVHSGRDESVEILKKGNLLSVAPGRVREAFCSNENYNILWGNHKGFAQVAIDAKVVSGFLYVSINMCNPLINVYYTCIGGSRISLFPQKQQGDRWHPNKSVSLQSVTGLLVGYVCYMPVSVPKPQRM